MASYCSLLGAVSLPCHLAILLRARSQSGTCGGYCGGCECSKLPLHAGGASLPCRLAALLFRCWQGVHQEPAEGAAEGAVEAASPASYRSLLGAISLPCHPAALSFHCMQRAHQEPVEGAAEAVGEALVVRRACEHSELPRLQSLHRLAVLPQISGWDHECGKLPLLLPSPRLTTVKENCQESMEAMGDTPMTQRSKSEPFRPSSINSCRGMGEVLAA
ncbi:hypothetical protein NDU88_004021 [Pleurodeles waltl]|uniref:Uncharacterized protein n=1 Tax=Pleurodeles waltl TaxID=8319 RepID=A0AAV7VEZ8_PLEWA|nr:hypothetical protein NDU88_004021 [Pleurodeles waltl]